MLTNNFVDECMYVYRVCIYKVPLRPYISEMALGIWKNVSDKSYRKLRETYDENMDLT